MKDIKLEHISNWCALFLYIVIFLRLTNPHKNWSAQAVIIAFAIGFSGALQGILTVDFSDINNTIAATGSGNQCGCNCKKGYGQDGSPNLCETELQCTNDSNVSDTENRFHIPCNTTNTLSVDGTGQTCSCSCKVGWTDIYCNTELDCSNQFSGIVIKFLMMQILLLEKLIHVNVHVMEINMKVVIVKLVFLDMESQIQVIQINVIGYVLIMMIVVVKEQLQVMKDLMLDVLVIVIQDILEMIVVNVILVMKEIFLVIVH